MIKMFKYFVFVFLIFETLIADVFKVRINDKVEVIPAFYEARTLYISLPDFLRLLEVDYTSDTLNGSFLFQKILAETNITSVQNRKEFQKC